MTRVNEDMAERQWRLCPWCGREGCEGAERLFLRTMLCPAFKGSQAPPMVPREQLEHGAYYHGICRNATVARWNAERQEFVHWRTKFHDVFPEAIGYWTEARPGEQRFDEFQPFGRMASPPFEIPLALEEFYCEENGWRRAGRQAPVQPEGEK